MPIYLTPGEDLLINVLTPGDTRHPSNLTTNYQGETSAKCVGVTFGYSCHCLNGALVNVSWRGDFLRLTE